MVTRGDFEIPPEAGEQRYSSGAKAQQRADKYKVNRQANYSSWRYPISEVTSIKQCGLYTTDFDFVEWSFNSYGELVAAAVIDATQADNGKSVNDTYLNNILERFHRQLQGKALSFASRRFECDSYILLFREDCSEFWMYNWTQQKGWKHMDSQQHIEWLKWTHEQAKQKRG